MRGIKKIRLLVVTEASLTGAPILLLNVLSLIEYSEKFDIKVLVKRYDSLVPEFKKHFKTYVLKGKKYQERNPSPFLMLVRFINSVWNRVFFYPTFLSTDIILSNSIVNGSILRELGILNSKTICYVHELETSISSWPNKADIEYSLRKSILFFAPSQLILDNLISNHGIAEDKTRLLVTYVPSPSHGHSSLKRFDLRKKFLKSYNLSEDVFMVVGMGTADKRKGIDLFLDTASLLGVKNSKIIFVWIGPFANKEIEEYVRDRVQKESGLSKLIFTGKVPTNFENLYPFDVFFLSSREDPYPLVVLEAAAVKLPTICFANSGGIVEFVEGGGGWVIKNFSVRDAVNLVEVLQSKKEMVMHAGEIAYIKFKNKHSNIEVTRQNLEEIINAVL